MRLSNRRTGICMGSILLLTACIVASAASPQRGEGAESDTVQHGSYRVTVHIALMEAIPQDATVICRLAATSTPPALLPRESVSALAVVSGSDATCILRMPLTWSIPQPTAQQQVSSTLRLSITEYPTSNAPAAPLRRIALPAIAVALPQPNGERALDLPLLF